MLNTTWLEGYSEYLVEQNVPKDIAIALTKDAMYSQAYSANPTAFKDGVREVYAKAGLEVPYEFDRQR